MELKEFTLHPLFYNKKSYGWLRKLTTDEVNALMEGLSSGDVGGEPE